MSKEKALLKENNSKSGEINIKPKEKVSKTKKITQINKKGKQSKNSDEKERKKEKYIRKPIKRKSRKKYIYIGDTIASKDINIVKHSIIENLNRFKILFEKDSELKRLFIELSEYAKIKHKLSNPNHILNRIIRKRRINNGI